MAAEHLRVLGFTDWESRAYLALLERSPVSGYEVAKWSGVPRAKVYEVLASLRRKGAVHLARGEPALYGPVPPGELVERARARVAEELDAAEATMAEHAARTGDEAVIWDLKGRAEIIARARRLIEAAQHRLLLEIWSHDADELREHLRDAADRDVEIIAVAYGEPDYPFAKVYPHPLTDEVTHGLGGRWLVISADEREIVAGNVSGGDSSRAAWSSHPGLVTPITELIRHDLYKLEVLAAHGDVLERDFGPGLGKLRERFGAGEQYPAGGSAP